MKTLRLTMPLPPSVNNQYVTIDRRRRLSPEAKKFRRSAANMLRGQLGADPAIQEFMDSLPQVPFACDMVFYFETPLKRDLDGGLKIALDALSEALGIDDRYAVSITLEKRIDPLSPRLEVEIGLLPDWQFDEEYIVLPED
jgi:crossover junction endodeoxyribonuclease RusA